MEKIQLTVKIAGDSGDGIQLTGHRLAMIHALFGHDVATFADYPAEIRAPKGTIYGVSAYQLQISSEKIHTPGDDLDILVAFNPAAYKLYIPRLRPGGTLIVNEDTFSDEQLAQVEISDNPLDSPAMDRFTLARLPMDQLLAKLFESAGLKKAEIQQTKNFFALGVICWLLSKSTDSTQAWLNERFGEASPIARRNISALSEGYTAALVRELLPIVFTIPSLPSSSQPGTRYRFLTGNSALALGLMAAREQAGCQLFFAGYPITPASSIYQTLTTYHHPQLITYQAEDEIAAIGSALGAAWGGSLAAVATSGPGLCLMSEFLGLAVITELPLLVINVQRAGPSTGMPTKTEQSDLYLALWGRNGDAPVVVLAPKSPAHGFECLLLAAKIAIERSGPVVILSDGYLAHGHEIWPIPPLTTLPTITSPQPTIRSEGSYYEPFLRNPQTGARSPAFPGLKGYEHILGGLEKTPQGQISYEARNHEMMTQLRREKVEKTTGLLPKLTVEGDPSASKIIITWGSTYGAVKKWVHQHRLSCHPHERLAHVHLISLWPLQPELERIIKKYPSVVVLESNSGQALTLLRRALPNCSIEGVQKVDGQPWSQKEISCRLIPWMNKNPAEPSPPSPP